MPHPDHLKSLEGVTALETRYVDFEATWLFGELGRCQTASARQPLLVHPAAVADSDKGPLAR